MRITTGLRFTNALIKFWWKQVPLAVGRISQTLQIMILESAYLVAWPRLAGFSPILALFGGFICGWLRFGADQVFTQSGIILALAIVFGCISSYLGMIFTFGFVMADLLVFDPPVFGFFAGVEVRIALLITYVALFLIAVGVPFLVRLLREQIPAGIAQEMPRFIMEVVITGLLCAVLLYLALQTIPLLLRPVYTWRGSTPPVDAMMLIQQFAWIFVLLGSVFSALRVILEYTAVAQDPGTVIEISSLTLAQQPGFFDALAAPIKLVFWSLFTTFLLAGLLNSLVETIVLFVGVLSIVFLHWLLGQRSGPWLRLMKWIPVVVRLGVSLIGSYVISAWVLSNASWGISFQPMVWALLLSLVLMALLFPDAYAREPGGAP